MPERQPPRRDASLPEHAPARAEVLEGLQRVPLFGGVPFKVLIIEGALGATLLLMGQLSFFSVALALGAGLGLHLLMKNLIDGDPLYMEQLRAALRYKSYYASHGHYNTFPPAPRRTIST